MTAFSTDHDIQSVYVPRARQTVKVTSDGVARTTDPVVASRLARHPLFQPDPTREELYQEARRLDVEGRSEMTKDELAEAVEPEGSGD
jgi:hypothetical protein